MHTQIPYSTASKLFLCSNTFMAKSSAQTLTFNSVTNRPTNRQTDGQKTQHFCPPRRCLKAEPHQTWHGDRGRRTRSCASITFGGRCSFAARGRWKFGSNQILTANATLKRGTNSANFVEIAQGWRCWGTFIPNYLHKTIPVFSILQCIVNAK